MPVQVECHLVGYSDYTSSYSGVFENEFHCAKLPVCSSLLGQPLSLNNPCSDHTGCATTLRGPGDPGRLRTDLLLLLKMVQGREMEEQQ